MELQWSTTWASLQHILRFSNLNVHEYLKQGKSTLHKHIGFFHSSVPGNPASGAPGKSIESLLCVYWTASGF
ncbi:hypothetical protein RHMOL_Rhmol06G0077600 [Rhododendron molle]|uniref:Uncharacterized protein n=1 Tax=Rhododendron molle TaxID=49168 RepID=A0ACC0NBY5_RHOML|nr:hypothetical protein RHMOL_Rhmol06G0077600 [Rhododendron molle]